MQEDKEPVFDAIDTVEMCLPVFGAMLETLTVRPKNMAKAAAGGFINATDCADYLVKKGMPFREAYMIVGRLVNMCIQLRREPGNSDPAGLPCHQRPVRRRRVRSAGTEDTAFTNGRSTAAPARTT